MIYDKTYNKLFGALIGVARSIDWYSPIEETSMQVIYKIFSTVSSHEELLDESALSTLTKELHLEKLRLVPDCFHCLNRCGRTDDYDMELIWNAEESVRNAKFSLLEMLVTMPQSISYSEDKARCVVKGLLSLGEAYSADMIHSITNEVKQTGAN